MAKCPICDSRKGKRTCLIADGPICTLCCGQIRKEETCRGCTFYKAPDQTRKYREVPSYTTQQMEDSDELQTYANAIEGAICTFDHDMDGIMNDAAAIRLIELLLDKYHFRDESFTFDNDLLERAFHYVDKVIETDLAEVPVDKLVKILAVIHFVAKRRCRGGRDYLDIIHRYVGIRVASGILLRQDLEDLS